MNPRVFSPTSLLLVATTIMATAIVLAARPAPAQSPAPGANADQSGPPQSSPELSGTFGGALITGPDGGLPSGYLCGTMVLARRIGLGGCGRGSGLITESRSTGGAELAHFRGEWILLTTARGASTIRLSLGIGLAEAQLGPDRLGFVFNPGPSPSTTEVAGPEIAATARIDSPQMGPLRDLYTQVDLGVASLPGWTAIGGPGGDIAPFAIITANGRF